MTPLAARALILAVVPLTVAGIPTRFVSAAAAALVLVAAALFILVRRRRPGVEVRNLDPAQVARYLATFAGVEQEFESRPGVAIGQARGIVEEVLRRMGFPDRIDAAQKARDLAAHNRPAAAALEAADRALREGTHGDSLRRAMTAYRDVLQHLLEDVTVS